MLRMPYCCVFTAPRPNHNSIFRLLLLFSTYSTITILHWCLQTVNNKQDLISWTFSDEQIVQCVIPANHWKRVALPSCRHWSNLCLRLKSASESWHDAICFRHLNEKTWDFITFIDKKRTPVPLSKSKQGSSRKRLFCNLFSNFKTALSSPLLIRTLSLALTYNTVISVESNKKCSHSKRNAQWEDCVQNLSSKTGVPFCVCANVV